MKSAIENNQEVMVPLATIMRKLLDQHHLQLAAIDAIRDGQIRRTKEKYGIDMSIEINKIYDESKIKAIKEFDAFWELLQKDEAHIQ
jgi:hypothetical protein